MDQVESLIPSVEGKGTLIDENIPLTGSYDGDNFENPPSIMKVSKKKKSVVRTDKKILTFGKSTTNEAGGHCNEEEGKELYISRLLTENKRLKRELEEMDEELRRTRSIIKSANNAAQMDIDDNTAAPTPLSDEIIDSDKEGSSWQWAKAWKGLRNTTDEKDDAAMYRNNNVIVSEEQVKEQLLIHRHPVLPESTQSPSSLPSSSPMKPDFDYSCQNSAPRSASSKSKNSDSSCSDTELSCEDEEVGCLDDGENCRARRDDEDDTQVSPNTENNEESFAASMIERSSWLVGLLVLQSLSGFILQSNEQMLKEHTVIINFLTMLVGAGGNAGNQASVRVIRGLAVGTLNSETQGDFLRNEAKMALCMGSILGLTGFIRAAVFLTPRAETIAITSSLIAIVVISIGLGSTLPLAMKKVRIDPAHSSTTIQVIMDILGVSITCWVCALILKTGLTKES